MYRWRGREPVFLDSKRDWSSNSDWTETPLYTADQLEAARKQGWNEAFEAAAEQCELWVNKLRLALKNAQARKQQEEARDLESMVMSAFRAFQTRALTKENSDG